MPVAANLTRDQYHELKRSLEKNLLLRAKQPQVSLEKHHFKKRPMCLEKHQHLPRPSLEKPSLAKMQGSLEKLARRPLEKVKESWLPESGMFSSPSKKARTASSSQVMCLRRAGSRLHAAMGYGLEKPKPKAKAKPAKKPASCLGKGKSKPGKALADEPKERGPWVDLKQTDANKPQPRSYLQGRVEGGKLHLIVAVTQNMSIHHLAIIGKIRCALEKDNLTKAEALAMRKELLEKYSP